MPQEQCIVREWGTIEQQWRLQPWHAFETRAGFHRWPSHKWGLRTEWQRGSVLFGCGGEERPYRGLLSQPLFYPFCQRCGARRPPAHVEWPEDYWQKAVCYDCGYVGYPEHNSQIRDDAPQRQGWRTVYLCARSGCLSERVLPAKFKVALGAGKVMHVTFNFREGWQRDPKVFETQKAVLSSIGKLADEKPDHIDGYMAERPEVLPQVIRVWAPCGCCLTYMSASASVLTQCENEKDDFNWTLAEEALNALRRAEMEQSKEGAAVEPSKLAIVKLAPKQ